MIGGHSVFSNGRRNLCLSAQYDSDNSKWSTCDVRVPCLFIRLRSTYMSLLTISGLCLQILLSQTSEFQWDFHCDHWVCTTINLLAKISLVSTCTSHIFWGGRIAFHQWWEFKNLKIFLFFVIIIIIMF